MPLLNRYCVQQAPIMSTTVAQSREKKMSLRISAFADEVGFYVHSTRSGVNKYAIDADAWIEGATAAGWMPHLRQRPLSAGYVAGEWQIATLKDAANPVRYPGPIPEALWDDIFIRLGWRGLVKAQPELKVWNGDVLPDVLSAGAVLVRLSLLRVAAAQPAAMALELSNLQAHLAKSEGKKLEIDEPMIDLLEKYAERAGIPEHWLIWGIAEEL
ncbi:hypothetical protein Rvan_2523 [Rhodomicrobium vannielii ATCC 17100]|uniref:Uncharacterized protein n=2 Tax=Rhodomicrobium vannielii TaxID=1069 RepID=E3I673_RHOVT|nr:hypothetical protein Rvan_2523 [Rhodomicrobium vannielii ATCC 17100]